MEKEIAALKSPEGGQVKKAGCIYANIGEQLRDVYLASNPDMTSSQRAEAISR